MVKKIIYLNKFIMKKNLFPVLLIAILFSACNNQSDKKNDRLAKASRENKNGWVYLHLEGSPADIGYQHGYLLSEEIDSSMQMLSYYLQNATKRDWNFYRSAADRFYWNKLD